MKMGSLRINLNSENVRGRMLVDEDKLIRRRLRCENFAKTFIFLVGNYDSENHVVKSSDLLEFTNWSRSYCTQQLNFYKKMGFLRATYSKDGFRGRTVIKFIMDVKTKMHDEGLVNKYVKIAKETLGLKEPEEFTK